jgi:YceI-like protein
MKMSKSLLVTILSASLFIACTPSKNSNEKTTEEVSSAIETCTYSYSTDSTSLIWTAYKFTARAGVSGTFNHIVVNNTREAETMAGVLIGADFSIHTPSVNSGNLERDPKLVEFFFNKLANTETITGKISSIQGDIAKLSITMNENTIDVTGKVVMEGEKVSLSVSIDLSDFDGLDAVSSLNAVCSAKHTDKDGESKLWPDVDIVVSTIVKKECK